MSNIEIPQHLFRHRNAVDQIVAEQSTLTPIVKLEWNKGIFLWLKGADFPQKTLTSPETLWAINFAKKNFIEGLKFLSSWHFYPSWVIVMFLPWKKKVKFLDKAVRTYNDLSWRAISPFVLKSEYMTPVAQEIEWFCFTFLQNLGIEQERAERFGEIFASLIEYDNAYRYRVEDIFSETTKTKLVENPRKEILRLMEMVMERDNHVVAVKFRLLAKMMGLLLFHPKIKKAFVKAVNEIDVRRLGLDEADRYWVCFRKDYKFLGKTYEERQELVKDKGKPVIINR